MLYVIADRSDFLPRLGEDGKPGHMAQLIRHLEPRVIPDASHMVHHERPELLAQEIRDLSEAELGLGALVIEEDEHGALVRRIGSNYPVPGAAKE